MSEPATPEPPDRLTIWPKVFIAVMALNLVFVNSLGTFLYVLMVLGTAVALVVVVYRRYRDPAISKDFLVGQVFWGAIPSAIVVTIFRTYPALWFPRTHSCLFVASSGK